MKDIETINLVDHELVRTFYGCFSDISHLQDEMNPARKPVQLPAINVLETASAYYFDMALPGYHKKDLHLELEGDILTVDALQPTISNKNVKRFHRQEFGTGHFTRSFLLPEDAGTAIASFSNGVLHIRLQKGAAVQSSLPQNSPQNSLPQKIKIPVPIQ